MRLCWFNSQYAMVYNPVSKQYTLVDLQKWRLERSKIRLVSNVTKN